MKPYNENTVFTHTKNKLSNELHFLRRCYYKMFSWGSIVLFLSMKHHIKLLTVAFYCAFIGIAAP